MTDTDCMIAILSCQAKNRLYVLTQRLIQPRRESAMTKITRGVVNPSNQTAVELSRQVGQLKILKDRKTTKLYDVYLADPTAQFVMSFAKFKKRRQRRARI